MGDISPDPEEQPARVGMGDQKPGAVARENRPRQSAWVGHEQEYQPNAKDFETSSEADETQDGD